MNWEDWTLQTIGLYGNGKYLDDIEEDFGVEVFDTEDEMLEIKKDGFFLFLFTSACASVHFSVYSYIAFNKFS